MIVLKLSLVSFKFVIHVSQNQRSDFSLFPAGQYTLNNINVFNSPCNIKYLSVKIKRLQNLSIKKFVSEALLKNSELNEKSISKTILICRIIWQC